MIKYVQVIYMKLLKYTLVSNNKVMNDEELPYVETSEKITFKLDQDIYEFHKNSCSLIKKTKEGKITIDFNKSLIVIEVSGVGSFDLPIKVKNKYVSSKSIELKYITKTEEKIENDIKINLV